MRYKACRLQAAILLSLISQMLEPTRSWYCFDIICNGIRSMAYLVVILVAFFSKSFFNSKLCRGEYGFFKTYFLYGGAGAFAILFGVIFLFGPSALKNDSATGHYALLSTARLALFCLAVYLTGIALAVYKLRSRSEFTPLMNLYVAMILIAFVILVPSSVFMAPVYFAVYAAAMFAFYKLRWNSIFIESLT